MLRRAILIAASGLLPGQALADTLVALHTMRARTIVAPADVGLQPGEVAGALTGPEEAIGLETRGVIYAGRPIRARDLGQPAIVERNQIIPLLFRRGSLEIRTEGRALDRAGIGETIRVMNAASKTVVSATLGADGTAHVAP